jgi:glycosyltransferase involved in cell wall biosynthesis
VSVNAPGILLVGNYPPPFGGIPRHLEDLVPHLVATGWKVHILSGPAGQDTRAQGYEVHRAKPKLRRVPDLAQFGMKHILQGRAGPLLSAARELPATEWLGLWSRASRAGPVLEQAGIRVISGYNLLSGGAIATLLGELYRVPVVVTNLGEIYSHRSALERRLSLVKRIVRGASRLLSPTHHCARSYRELGLSPDVTVIHHGIDVERFNPSVAADPVRRRLGFAAEQQMVLYVGRMVADMGLDTLLEAIPQVLNLHPETRFVIAGGGGDLLPRAQAAARQWPKHVAVSVDVPLTDLPAYYAAASIVAAPTRGARACGSLAAAEAMATARPVVASNVGGIPEFVLHDETGLLVPAGNPGSLADALVQLLANAPRRSAYGAAGRRRVEGLFDTRVTNRGFERVFREAAGLA